VSLEGFSLLEVTSLNTRLVAARLANTDIHDATARRRAGMFKIAVVDKQLVLVDADNGSEVSPLRLGGKQLEGELERVRQALDRRDEQLKSMRMEFEGELARLRRELKDSARDLDPSAL
jgi:hypothetical protein